MECVVVFQFFTQPAGGGIVWQHLISMADDCLLGKVGGNHE